MSKIMRTISLRLFLVLCVGITLTSCTTSTPTLTSSYPSPGSDIQGSTVASFVITHSIAELTLKSELIVLAQVIRTDEIINMARKPEDPTQPNEEYLTLGQVYEVDVKRILKGDVKIEPLLLIQREGNYEGNASIDDIKKVQEARVLDRANYRVPDQDKEYLIFLRPYQGYPEGKYYTGTAHPYLFIASDPMRVSPFSPWNEAPLYFPTQTLENMIFQIEHPEAAPSPYPAPVEQ